MLVSPPQAVTIGFRVCAELLLPVYQASPVLALSCLACACPSDFALHYRASPMLVLRTSLCTIVPRLCLSFGLCFALSCFAYAQPYGFACVCHSAN
ncbi:MAG: hypothetical protein IJ368_06830 [Oscillospiraceae bacterium]|nr:hypothetical protein [Oscillospiraceae bacterium]